MELNKARNNIGEAESAIATQKAQLEKLNHVVAEADAGGARGVQAAAAYDISPFVTAGSSSGSSSLATTGSMIIREMDVFVQV